MDGKSYIDDGVQISPTEMYQAMRDSEMLPTTAPPSGGDYFIMFQKLIEQGYHDVIYLSLSHNLSSDYNCAFFTAQAINSNYSDSMVYVVDSGIAALPQGFLAKGAAEKAQSGWQVQNILRWIDEAKTRVGLVAVLDTLEYLARGGRIGKASRFLGSLLDMKPLLSVIEGVVTPVAVQRGSKKVLPALVNLVKEKIQGCQHTQLAILHADAMDQAMKLKVKVEDTFSTSGVDICELTPMMGVHVGPGVIGLAYYYE